MRFKKRLGNFPPVCTTPVFVLGSPQHSPSCHYIFDLWKKKTERSSSKKTRQDAHTFGKCCSMGELPTSPSRVQNHFSRCPSRGLLIYISQPLAPSEQFIVSWLDVGGFSGFLLPNKSLSAMLTLPPPSTQCEIHLAARGQHFPLRSGTVHFKEQMFFFVDHMHRA